MAILENISTYDWGAAFVVKNRYIASLGFEKIEPLDFYRDLFPVGSFETKGQTGVTGKGNGILTVIRTSKDKINRQWIITDDHALLSKAIDDDFALLPPISFFGKTHSKKNACELFAMTVDIDYVGHRQLMNLLWQFENGVQLTPTYIVNSGKGVHLYYFLDTPVRLYPWVINCLVELKEAFIRRLWNDTTSLKPDMPDSANLFQGFRAVGSKSKMGSEFVITAFKLTDRRYNLAEIRDSIPECIVDLSPINPEWRIVDSGIKKNVKIAKKRLTLEEAKEKYPDWYQHKIVEKKTERRLWIAKRDLYEWWKRKMLIEVREGGRYFSIMALCAYGLKCGISEDEIKKDAYGFLEYYDRLTTDNENHFKKSDIDTAINNALSDKNYTRTHLSKREWIEKNTKVSIPANKRNFRRRQEHLQADFWYNKDGFRSVNVCKMNRELKLHDMRELGMIDGRRTAKKIVDEWRKKNPNGKKADCIRDTGLSKPTVLKWWNGEKSPKEKIAIWRDQNPNGLKADCVRETGISKPTVIKWWEENT